MIRSQRANGYIIVGQSYQHEALNLAAQGFLPLVVGEGTLPDQRYCTVGSDDYNGGRLATEHLIRIGRQRILFVGPADLPQIDMRFAGYRDALVAHGLLHGPTPAIPAHFSGPEAYERVAKVLKAGTKVDAVFAASDGIAVSVIKAIEVFAAPRTSLS